MSPNGHSSEYLWGAQKTISDLQKKIVKQEAVAKAALDVHHGYVNGIALDDLITILGKAITAVEEGES